MRVRGGKKSKRKGEDKKGSKKVKRRRKIKITRSPIIFLQKFLIDLAAAPPHESQRKFV